MSTETIDNIPMPADFIAPPTVSTSPMGEIPSEIYTARIIRGTDKKSDNSGSRMIEFECEILSPDQVPSQFTPNITCAVAGRKFSIYAIIDTASKAFKGGYDMLAKLMLLHPSGGISPSHAVNIANTGTVAFQVALASELEYHRKPKMPGEKQGAVIMIPGTNTPFQRGWRVQLPGAEHILQRVALPEGFVVQQF